MCIETQSNLFKNILENYHIYISIKTRRDELIKKGGGLVYCETCETYHLKVDMIDEEDMSTDDDAICEKCYNRRGGIMDLRITAATVTKIVVNFYMHFGADFGSFVISLPVYCVTKQDITSLKTRMCIYK